MRIEDIKFKQKASERIYTDYMKRIKRATASLSKINQDDIYMEFNSHIFEAIQHKSQANEIDSLLDIIEKLGAPEEVLKPLVADKKLDHLVSENKEQVIEVEFDYQIQEQLLAKLENITSYKNIHDMTWELTFVAEKDMRPAIFDFANENGLKTLQLNKKNKNLEAVFREITK